MPEPILVVEDEAILRGNLARYLRAKGHDVFEAANGAQALEVLAATPCAVVLTDLRMPVMDGSELLERVAAEQPETMVVVMTAYASVDTALEALRAGAQDYLLKPLVHEEVARRVGTLLAHRELELRLRGLRRQLRAEFEREPIVGNAPATRAVLDLVARAAPSRATVLLEGETGTGKELLARAVHENSPARDAPYLAVNLAAQPESLVDAALFGHERGAFSGATQRREGVLRAAGGGTVFLDEVGELSLPVQAKLLRAIENREVLPLGRDVPVPADFRLVCATNRSLRQCVEEGTFRKDLYYRINVFRIAVPPLRKRGQDIPALVELFVARHARANRKRLLRVSNEAMRHLLAYPWPGNVRELANVVERAVLLATGDTIDLSDLPAELRDQPAEPRDLSEAVEQFRRRHIRRVLAEVGGDKERAAAELGIHRATLYRHLDFDGVG